jgi:hypothetical protein
MPPVDVATPAAKRPRRHGTSSKIKLEIANAAANAALGATNPMPKYHWQSLKPSTSSMKKQGGGKQNPGGSKPGGSG